MVCDSYRRDPVFGDSDCYWGESLELARQRRSRGVIWSIRSLNSALIGGGVSDGAGRWSWGQEAIGERFLRSYRTEKPILRNMERKGIGSRGKGPNRMMAINHEPPK